MCIRRVSTLWKTCVEFRLSRAAIGRYFPGAPKAGMVYAGLEEEALEFIRLGMLLLLLLLYLFIPPPNLTRCLLYSQDLRDARKTSYSTQA